MERRVETTGYGVMGGAIQSPKRFLEVHLDQLHELTARLSEVTQRFNARMASLRGVQVSEGGKTASVPNETWTSKSSDYIRSMNCMLDDLESIVSEL